MRGAVAVTARLGDLEIARGAGGLTLRPSDNASGPRIAGVLRFLPA